MEGRSVGTKGNDSRLDLTSAKDLTIELVQFRFIILISSFSYVS